MRKLCQHFHPNEIAESCNFCDKYIYLYLTQLELFGRVILAHKSGPLASASAFTTQSMNIADSLHVNYYNSYCIYTLFICWRNIYPYIFVIFQKQINKTTQSRTTKPCFLKSYIVCIQRVVCSKEKTAAVEFRVFDA